MKVYVNAELHELKTNSSLADLIQTLGLQNKRIAVERNQAIVPKGLYDSTMLSEGDRLEIVIAVGGG
jgi:sulfur carrier protein